MSEEKYKEVLEQAWRRLKSNPEMIINADENYVIVKASDENLEKFFKKYGTLIDGIHVYYNEPEDYEKIAEGIFLRNRLDKEPD